MKVVVEKKRRTSLTALQNLQHALSTCSSPCAYVSLMSPHGSVVLGGEGKEREEDEEMNVYVHPGP